MIQPNELRKGNLVYQINRSGSVHIPDVPALKIVTLGLFEAEILLPSLNPANQSKLPSAHYSDLSPISLSESWLIKTGFVINEDAGMMVENDGKRVVYKNKIHISVLDNIFRLFIHIDEDSWYSFEWTEIKYLHELQNIYFVLAKTELEINL